MADPFEGTHRWPGVGRLSVGCWLREESLQPVSTPNPEILRIGKSGRSFCSGPDYRGRPVELSRSHGSWGNPLRFDRQGWIAEPTRQKSDGWPSSGSHRSANRQGHRGWRRWSDSTLVHQPRAESREPVLELRSERNCMVRNKSFPGFLKFSSVQEKKVKRRLASILRTLGLWIIA
jgi:hypothetical protein